MYASNHSTIGCRNTGGLLMLEPAAQQPSSRFSKRCSLLGRRQEVIEKDTQHLPLVSICVNIFTHSGAQTSLCIHNK